MHGKKRTYAQVTETRSQKLFLNILPDEWVVRQLYPDYGLDLSIEVFEPDETETHVTYYATGEFLYIQLKGTEHIRRDLRSNDILFSLDTDLLKTVEKMGNIPVLLVVVDVIGKDVYYLCLNDYVKELQSTRPEYNSQKSVRVRISSENQLKNKNDAHKLRRKVFQNKYPFSPAQCF